MSHPLDATVHSLPAECGSPVLSSWQRYLPLVLAGVALLGLIPAIYFSGLRRIEYDAFRELFIATQDRWRDFVEEGRAGAHPLFFHLIMRGVYHLGHSHLIYRMPCMLATVGTAFLIGISVRRISGNALFAVLATWASAFSGMTIEMAISMRSYPIAVFFIVLSFYYLLKAWELPEGREAWKSCSVCSVALSLAILTEYFSVFYLAALLGLLVLRFAFDLQWKSRLARWLRGKTALVMAFLLLPVLVTVFLLVVHLGQHQVNSTFYWVPARESLPGFLARSLPLELSLLTPIRVSSSDVALVMLALAVVLMAAVRFLTRKQDLTPFVTWASILVLLLLLLQISTGAAANRYPFGGQLRHQYILSPFLIISFFVLAARVTNLLESLRWRAACGTAMLAVVAVVSCLAWRSVPIAPQENFVKDYADFRSAVGHSDLICVDLFSLIGYFGRTHDWHWQSEWRYDKGREPFIVYKTTSRTGEQVRVLRDKIQWNWNLKDPATYAVMAEELRFSGQTRMSLFYLEQIPDKISWPERETSVERLANQQGLKVDQLFPLPQGLGAVFELK
jgi:hypothetical protein